MDKLEVNNLSFFLLPESMETLRKRAEKRGGMTPEMIQDRITLAGKEIEQSKDFDYQITNYEGKLQQTTDNIASIIQKHMANSRPVDKN